MIHDYIQRKCYALECLSFLESAIIFHNVLLSNGLSQDERQIYHKMRKINPFLDKLFINLNFKYLINKYNKYQYKISNDEIDDILNEIYSKFISESSNQSINISWKARQKITQFFNNKQNILHTKSQTEIKYIYLELFNQAISEIFDPIDTVYNNYFKNI